MWRKKKRSYQSRDLLNCEGQQIFQSGKTKKEREKPSCRKAQAGIAATKLEEEGCQPTLVKVKVKRIE